MDKGFNFTSESYRKIIEEKYCLKTNDKKETFEESIKRIAINVNKYDNAKKTEMTNKTIQYISNQEFSPAGGIWRAAGNPKKRISSVNCTTQEPVKDSIEDIYGNSIKYWARIASYGQGNGIDISGLRPRSSSVNNCAKSSTGAVSFLRDYDSAMQTIGAENRRGATKPDLWVYHPDIEEFISCKQDITKLTSANISVKVDDDFMKAVEDNKEIELKWERKEDKVFVGNRVINESEGPELIKSRTVKASDIFDQIATQAWQTGEPGIEFWSTSEKFSNSNYHPNKKYHIVSTNGCSEQKLDPFNTCILSSLNFYKMPLFSDDWKSWIKERVEFAIRFLDNVIEMEYQEKRSPHPTQREKLRKMPRIGLGFTGLADWFIKNKVIYGSKESLEMTDKVMAYFTEIAYRTSISLGKERGSFSEFKQEWFTKSEFIKNLCKYTKLKLSDFLYMRHSAALSVAPTGTISMLLGAGGSGAEQLIFDIFTRKERATTGDWVYHNLFDSCIINECKKRGIELTKENVEKLIKDPEWVFMKDVDPIDKIKLMGVIYKYIDSGVSITYNLQKSATVKDVKNIYMEAWKHGLKSVTVYRDGSREGVISKDRAEDKINKNNSPRRPKELNCDIHHLTVKGERWVVLVGKLGNDPYEVFCGLEELIELPKKYNNGRIDKVKRGTYNLLLEEDFLLKDIKKVFGNKEAESSLTRMISVALRHGADVKFITHQLEKSSEEMMCFSKAISRVLKKYIIDGEKVTGESCPNCGSEDLIRKAGCITCFCGWSKCM